MPDHENPRAALQIPGYIVNATRVFDLLPIGFLSAWQGKLPGVGNLQLRQKHPSARRDRRVKKTGELYPVLGSWLAILLVAAGNYSAEKLPRRRTLPTDTLSRNTSAPDGARISRTLALCARAASRYRLRLGGVAPSRSISSSAPVR